MLSLRGIRILQQAPVMVQTLRRGEISVRTDARSALLRCHLLVRAQRVESSCNTGAPMKSSAREPASALSITVDAPSSASQAAALEG